MAMHLFFDRMMVGPDLSRLVLVFFIYSFLGYLMECAVLSIDHRKFVYNRGFVKHLPFCIIYGFGAIIGYAMLAPFKDNLVVLFFAGAFFATIFEYLVARLQIHLFGDFWWDYSNKPFNFQGILCLESTIGWGFVGIVITHVLHGAVVGTIRQIPLHWAQPLAALLLLVYAADFALCAHKASMEKRQRQYSEQSENHTQLKLESKPIESMEKK